MRNCWSLWNEPGTYEATRATLKMRLQLESQTFPPMSHERATYRLVSITLIPCLSQQCLMVFRHQGSNCQALHTNTTHCSTLILVGMLGWPIPWVQLDLEETNFDGTVLHLWMIDMWRDTKKLSSMLEGEMQTQIGIIPSIIYSLVIQLVDIEE